MRRRQMADPGSIRAKIVRLLAHDAFSTYSAARIRLHAFGCTHSAARTPLHVLHHKYPHVCCLTYRMLTYRMRFRLEHTWS